jgi:hypothetical protein
MQGRNGLFVIGLLSFLNLLLFFKIPLNLPLIKGEAQVIRHESGRIVSPLGKGGSRGI